MKKKKRGERRYIDGEKTRIWEKGFIVDDGREGMTAGGTH